MFPSPHRGEGIDRRPGKRSATGQKKALHRRAFSASGLNIRHIALLLQPVTSVFRTFLGKEHIHHGVGLLFIFVADGQLHQTAGIRIQRRFAQLHRVHLAQPFKALHVRLALLTLQLLQHARFLFFRQRVVNLFAEVDTVQRRQRQRQGLPVCAIVGYTNAGKSSLLNALTGAGVLVEDKLFATLDAATRRVELEPGAAALLTDTVGFIRQLPHSLINAFRSTLEEAALADILIHVLDASEPDIEIFHQTTLSVLRELGAKEIPVLTALNKIDRLTEPEPEALRSRFPGSLAVSVKAGTGLDELKKRAAALLREIH